MLQSAERYAIYMPYDGDPMLGRCEHIGDREWYKLIRRAVKGTIEATYPSIEDDRLITLWMNDEARFVTPDPNLWATALNFERYGYDMVGDGIITSATEDGRTIGLTEAEVENVWETLRKALPRLPMPGYGPDRIEAVITTHQDERSVELGT